MVNWKGPDSIQAQLSYAYSRPHDLFDDDVKVATIKKLYNELELPALFTKYEEDSYKQIQAQLYKLKTITF